MCYSVKLLTKVKSGKLLYCKTCKVFHLSFNNMFFELSLEELNSLKSYINSLDIDYWEQMHSCFKLKRKIPLPSAQKNLVFMFNRQEIQQLKMLLDFNKSNTGSIDYTIGLDDIDYTLILN